METAGDAGRVERQRVHLALADERSPPTGAMSARNSVCAEPSWVKPFSGNARHLTA
jgi:hypothetical protein